MNTVSHKVSLLFSIKQHNAKTKYIVYYLCLFVLTRVNFCFGFSVCFGDKVKLSSRHTPTAEHIIRTTNIISSTSVFLMKRVQHGDRTHGECLSFIKSLTHPGQ